MEAGWEQPLMRLIPARATASYKAGDISGKLGSDAQKGS